MGRIVARRSMFETNSSSTHAVALYNGDNPVSESEYFNDVIKHIDVGGSRLLMIDSLDIPDTSVSFYDKLRAVIAASAVRFWDMYSGPDFNDEWFAPSQITGVYPMSPFPMIELAVKNILNSRGIETAGIEVRKTVIDYKAGFGRGDVDLVHVVCPFDNGFIPRYGLDTYDGIRSFLEDPSRHIAVFEDCSIDDLGKEGAINESRQYDEYYGRNRKMRTERRSVFETNSSSTHSITIIPKPDYDAMSKDSDLWYHRDHGLKTRDEAIATLPIECVEENDADELDTILADHGWFNEAVEPEYLERDINTYTTKGGDSIVIVCRYGYDG